MDFPNIIDQARQGFQNSINEIRNNRPRDAGIIARYPLNTESSGDPFVLFTKHMARYNRASGQARVDMVTQDHVSLYMPMGFAINDQAVFETAATGVLGGVADAVLSGVDPVSTGTTADLAAIATNAADTIGGAAGGLAGSIAGLAGGRVSGLVSGIVGSVGGGNIATAAAREIQKQTQVSVNPREFMLYKSPGMRNFSFRFRFIPDSLEESKAAEDIVRWFRRGMYPTVAGRYSFNFPDAFQIEIKNMQGLPKIPEVFLESCNVTFNPNSMSYFKQGNRPVEINMSLEFKELQPITRESIGSGF